MTIQKQVYEEEPIEEYRRLDEYSAEEKPGHAGEQQKDLSSSTAGEEVQNNKANGYPEYIVEEDAA